MTNVYDQIDASITTQYEPSLPKELSTSNVEGRNLTQYCSRLAVDIPQVITEGKCHDPNFVCLDLCCGTGKALSEVTMQTYAFGIDMCHYSNALTNRILFGNILSEAPNSVWSLIPDSSVNLILAVGTVYLVNASAMLADNITRKLKTNGLFLSDCATTCLSKEFYIELLRFQEDGIINLDSITADLRFHRVR